MYPEGAPATGYHRFLPHSNAPPPCACQSCVRFEPPPNGGPGFQAAPARRTDRPPRGKGGGAPAADGGERSGHRSPQRRPVFAGWGHYSQTDGPGQRCPWEPDPAQWGYPREQCGCVGARTHPFNALIPHPLPHLQVKGQGYRHRRTIRYVTVDEEEEGCGCPPETHSPRLAISNGHSGPGPGAFVGRETHQDWDRHQGSEEDCEGQGGNHTCFFPTEVPQKHLDQSRRKGPGAPTPGVPGPGPSKATTAHNQRCQASEAARQRSRQDSVRDQIRQVVTDLEDVLGGLKQVHVEMKEVVQQIDRLTANMDLSDGTPRVAQGLSDNSPSRLGRVRPNRKQPPALASQRAGEDRVILRTNSPSPVHIASVVKTSCFTPPNPERPGVNSPPPEPPHPQGLDPKVIIGSCTSTSKNQKPPPYPQNGRCGRGLHAAPRPPNGGRGRQSASMV